MHNKLHVLHAVKDDNHEALIKKKRKVSSYIKKFGGEQLKSHIWLTSTSYMSKYSICAFPHILGSPSSYTTLQPIPPEFPYIWGNFSFYQCAMHYVDPAMTGLHGVLIAYACGGSAGWILLVSRRGFSSVLYTPRSLPTDVKKSKRRRSCKVCSVLYP